MQKTFSACYAAKACRRTMSHIRQGFTRILHLMMAREAGAVYKIGKMVRVRRTIFEAYLRRIMLIEVAETDEEDEGFDGKGK